MCEWGAAEVVRRRLCRLRRRRRRSAGNSALAALFAGVCACVVWVCLRFCFSQLNALSCSAVSNQRGRERKRERENKRAKSLLVYSLFPLLQRQLRFHFSRSYCPVFPLIQRLLTPVTFQICFAFPSVKQRRTTRSRSRTQ